MKSRGLRPPDIVLPPPSPLLSAAATAAATATADSHQLISAPLLKTPGLQQQRKSQRVILRLPVRSMLSSNLSSPSTAPLSSGSPGSSRPPKNKYPPMTPIGPSPPVLADEDTSQSACSSPGQDSFEPDTPEDSSNTVRSRHASWSSSTDRIIKLAIDYHLSDPTVAPFAGLSPPPALLHRMAKTALKLARKEEHASLDNSISLAEIKRKILELITSFSITETNHNSPVASPILRNASSGPIRYLTRPDGYTPTLVLTNSYFPMPLNSPFQELKPEITVPARGEQKLKEIRD
ncbi:hypothetical protein V1514DRAFT_33311 [Lipomyces japonicus]|uniref:uncharacterized protein n=1 Tax=Lipomyces japonicus TaxID=56871 RepID=UPI0034CDAA25